MSKPRSKTAKNQSEITLLLKDGHLYLGILILVGIIFSIGVASIKISPVSPQPINQTRKAVALKPTPIPASDQSTTFQSVLAKTSNLPTVVKVANGESFWKISQKVCGSGVYYEKIKAENNYSSERALKQGDTIKVSCS